MAATVHAAYRRVHVFAADVDENTNRWLNAQRQWRRLYAVVPRGQYALSVGRLW